MARYTPSPWATQAAQLERLMQLAAAHSFEEPCLVMDPFGRAPLSAVVCFHTDWLRSFTLEVAGLCRQTPRARQHLIGVWGLPAGERTPVVLHDGAGERTVLFAETPSIQGPAFSCDGDRADFFGVVFADGEKGPLAYDAEGRLRWCLTDPCSHVLAINRRGHFLTGAPLNPAPPHAGTAIWEIDPLGYLYREWRFGAGFSDDLLEMADGSLLVIGGDPAQGTVRNTLWKLLPDGHAQIFWQPDEQLRQLPQRTGQSGSDPVQLTSLYEDPEEGYIWVSAAALGMSFVLDPVTAACRQIFAEGRLQGTFPEPPFCQVTYPADEYDPAALLPVPSGTVHLLSHRLAEGQGLPEVRLCTGLACRSLWQGQKSSPVLNRLRPVDDAFLVHLGAVAKDNHPPAIYRAMEKAAVTSEGCLMRPDGKVLLEYSLAEAAADLRPFAPMALKALNEEALGILGSWQMPLQVDIDLPVNAEEEGLDDCHGTIFQYGDALYVKASFYQGEAVALRLAQEDRTEWYYLPTNRRPYGSDWRYSVNEGIERPIIWRVPLADKTGRWTLALWVDGTLLHDRPIDLYAETPDKD